MIAEPAHAKICEYKIGVGLMLGVLSGYPLTNLFYDQPIDWRIMAVAALFFVLALVGYLLTSHRLKRGLYATNAKEVRDVIEHLQKKYKELEVKNL